MATQDRAKPEENVVTIAQKLKFPPKPKKPYPFKFLTRKEWGAMEPTEELPLLNHPIDYFIYKFSDTPACITRTACLRNIKELQKIHMTIKGLPDIAYNFIIGGDLTVYEGRGWFHKPTLLDDLQREYDGKLISIGYMGMTGGGIDPNFYCIEVLELREDLIDYGIEHGYMDDNCKFDRIDIWDL